VQVSQEAGDENKAFTRGGELMQKSCYKDNQSDTTPPDVPLAGISNPAANKKGGPGCRI